MNTNESIIDRIKRMELYFDTIRNALRTSKDISYNPEISTMLDALTSYYESKQWLADYSADERGEIPHNLKRGVLSEDGIYNLLSEIKTITENSEKYFSEFCDVSYNSDHNVVFVKWKKFCYLENYRKPLEFALEIIKKYKCDYVADTRDGFENIPEDNKWVADYFMPTAAEYGCRCIYFIIDENNSLKDELEGQENDSKSIIQFRYIDNINDIISYTSKGGNHMKHKDKANQYFCDKFHCSQAVLASFAYELGITEEQALKLGSCFGSGMRKGEVCGACTGALMVLGLKYGQYKKDDMESRNRTNLVSDKFLDEFKKLNGSYICNELLGCDISTPEGLFYAKEHNLFTEFCPGMVASAVEIIEKIDDFCQNPDKLIIKETVKNTD